MANPLHRWVERRGSDLATTTFSGWDDAAGIAWAVVSGLSTVALLGWRGVAAALLGGTGTAAGFRYRLVVGPGGIRYARTWFGLPWRSRRLPLDAPVTVRSTFENPDGDGVALGDGETVTFPAPRGQAEALRRALLDAVARARPTPPTA